MQKELRRKHLERFTMQNKGLTSIPLLFILFFLLHFCSAQDTLSKITFYGEKDSYQRCIGKEFVRLNRSYRTGIKFGLYYMYDLVFTDNKLTSENDTLYLMDKHIYHVVSPSVYGKVSMIIIPFDGGLFAFIGLNCCKKKHDVEDVVRWVSDNYPDVDHSTLENIRNYKAFHPNIPIDPQGSTPICEWRCRHRQSQKRYHYRKPKIIFRMKN